MPRVKLHSLSPIISSEWKNKDRKRPTAQKLCFMCMIILQFYHQNPKMKEREREKNGQWEIYRWPNVCIDFKKAPLSVVARRIHAQEKNKKEWPRATTLWAIFFLNIVFFFFILLHQRGSRSAVCVFQKCGNSRRQDSFFSSKRRGINPTEKS